MITEGKFESHSQFEKRKYHSMLTIAHGVHARTFWRLKVIVWRQKDPKVSFFNQVNGRNVDHAVPITPAEARAVARFILKHTKPAKHVHTT